MNTVYSEYCCQCPLSFVQCFAMLPSRAGECLAVEAACVVESQRGGSKGTEKEVRQANVLIRSIFFIWVAVCASTPTPLSWSRGFQLSSH